ncbi:MAG: polysaccharide deacetylase family protein, partial [bacterium]|nr:polysaccharide deacetylase family protein [bacterium]
KEFEKHMAYLAKHHFNVISISDLVGKLQRKEKIPAKTVVITIDDGYEDNYTHAFPILKKYKLPAGIFVATDLIGQFTTARKGTTMNKLGWSQMEEMLNSGLIEVFPHSHTHPKLDQLTPEFAEKEVKVSRHTLENQLGKSLPIFAYPYGRYNREVIEILRNQGFEAAFTVKTGRVHPGDNLFLLKRNSIDSKVSFAMFRGIVRSGRT